VRRLLAIAAICGTLGGCAHKPKQMYAGPPLPRSEICEVWSALPVHRQPDSKVRSEGDANGRLYILEVDGRPTDDWNENLAYVVHVLPGLHRFKVRYTTRREISPGRLGVVTRAVGEVEGQLQAGESYAIDAIPGAGQDTVHFNLRRLFPSERPPPTIEADT